MCKVGWIFANCIFFFTPLLNFLFQIYMGGQTNLIIPLHPIIRQTVSIISTIMVLQAIFHSMCIKKLKRKQCNSVNRTIYTWLSFKLNMILIISMVKSLTSTNPFLHLLVQNITSQFHNSKIINQHGISREFHSVLQRVYKNSPI